MKRGNLLGLVWAGVFAVLWAGSATAPAQMQCGITPWVEVKNSGTNLTRRTFYEEFSPLQYPPEFTNNVPRQFFISKSIRYNGTQSDAAAGISRVLTDWGWDITKDQFTGLMGSFTTNGTFTELFGTNLVTHYPANPEAYPYWITVPSGYDPYFPDHWTDSNFVSTTTHRYYAFNYSTTNTTLSGNYDEAFSDPYTAGMLVDNFFTALSNAPFASDWSYGTPQAYTDLTSYSPPEYADTDIDGNQVKYRFSFPSETNKNYIVVWELTTRVQTATGYTNTTVLMVDTNQIAGNGTNAYSAEYELGPQPVGQQTTVGAPQVFDASTACVVFTPTVLYVCAGGSADLSARVFPDFMASSVSFQVEDPDIAALGGSGTNLVVTGLNTNGSTTIQALVGTNVVSTALIYVVGIDTNGLTNVTVSPGGGAYFPLTLPSVSGGFDFQSSDTNIALVAGDSGGFSVFGVSNGTFSVLVRLNGVDLCKTIPGKVISTTNVTLTVPSYICVPNTVPIGARIVPASFATNVTFDLAETNASLSGTWPALYVTALSPGTNAIRAWSGTNLLASSAFTALQIELVGTNGVAVGVGGSTARKVSVQPPSATPGLTFKVADTNLATVSSSGTNFTVRGITEGTTSIDVKLGTNELCLNFDVEVNPGLPGVSLNPDSVCGTIPFKVVFTPTNSAPTNYSVVSDDSGIVSISGTNLVGVSPGVTVVRIMDGTNELGAQTVTSVQVTFSTNNVVQAVGSNVVYGILIEPAGAGVSIYSTDRKRLEAWVEGTNLWVKALAELPQPAEVRAQLGTNQICASLFVTSTNGCACDCAPGTVRAGLSSIDITVGLGRGLAGHFLDGLRLWEQAPNSLIGQPASLQYHHNWSEVSIRRSGSDLRQVKTPMVLADVVTISTNEFRVHFYLTNYVSGGGGGSLYSTSGTPFSVVKFENLGGVARDWLRVTESRGGQSFQRDYRWTATNYNWRLEQAGREEELVTAFTTNGTVVARLETRTMKPTGGSVVSKSVRTYHQLATGEALVEETHSPDDNPVTTTYSYTDSGLLASVERGDGTWERRQYGSGGWLTRVLTGVNTQGATDDPTLCRVVEYDYAAPAGSGDNGPFNPGVPRCITERLFDQPISRRYILYRTNEVWDIQCVTPDAAWNAAGNLVTVTRRLAGGTFDGEVELVFNPDGTIHRHTYTNLAGGEEVTTIWSGAPDSTGTNVNDGSYTITTNGVFGEPISVHTYDAASALLVNRLIYTNHDEFARPGTTIYLDGTQTSVSYGCCGVDTEYGRDGLATVYTYDDFQRVILTIRAGLTYSNAYDAAGNVVAVTRIGSGGSQILQRTAGYDAASRLLAETNAVNAVTTYSEGVDGSGNRTRTVTYADTGTRTETYGRDGSLYEVSGSAAAPQLRLTCLELVDGQLYRAIKEIRLSSTGGTTEWVKTCYDYLGRPFVVRYSGGGEERSYYNSQGRLERRVEADGVVTLYTHTAAGEPVLTAVDVNQNGTIDTAGPDRVTQMALSVTTGIGSVVVRRQQQHVYQTSSPELVATTDASVDGRRSWSIRNGQTNSSVTFIATDHHVWTTNTGPDGAYTVSDQLAGRLQSVTRYSSSGQQLGATTYDYDTHGRLDAVNDARNGATTHTHDDADRVVSMITPVPVPGGGGAQTNIYVYDDMGRVLQTIRPYNQTNFTDYFVTGQVQKNYGVLTYPVAYTYDAQGRMLTMTTWHDYANQTGEAVTTWVYDANRGHLRQKLYDNGTGPLYSYTSAGRLARRTWARGVVTDYVYNTAGDLAAVNYSDTTPDVSHTYDRLGRPETATAGTNSVSMTYSLNGRALMETNTAGILAGLTVIRAEDGMGRLTNMIAAGATNFYGYDAASRLSALTNGSLVVSRSYVSNSVLPASQQLAMAGTVRLTHQFDYDQLNRLQAISNVTAGAIGEYGYQYNQLNQRYQMTTPQGRTWSYEYDALGQVIGAGPVWAGTGTGVPGMQFGYSYDDIGNRKATVRDAAGGGWRTATYTNSLLNQLVQRTVPGYLNVLGEASSDVTVTVNAQSTTRHGTYYRAEVPVFNFLGPVWQGVTNLAVRLGGAPGGGDLGKTQTGNVLVPPTPEIFTHDADGNLLTDGRFSYTWDAENRLVALESMPEVPTAGRRAMQLVYDHLGRRIQKRGYQWVSGGYNYMVEQHFLYDGWNPVASLNSTNTVLQRYVWGADLSGTFQGAGGVGGLLAVFHAGNSGTYLVEYDGNGNVVGLVDAGTGAKAAVYEYGPFGEVLRAGGAAAGLNPFRFSTKYQDDETGFLYYGYRYYNPEIGRWASRDPIEEQGGKNLLSLDKNDFVNKVDILGNVIVGNCDLYDYLRSKLWIVRSTEVSGKYYYFSGRARAGGENDLETLILLRMIQSSTQFHIQGVSNKDVKTEELVRNLQLHIQARLDTVRNAYRSRFLFSTGVKRPAKLADETWDNYFERINRESIYMACKDAGCVLALSGVKSAIGGLLSRDHNNVFIPGDWGYIRNTSFVSGVSGAGTEGENIIHMGYNSLRGGDVWFGHLGGPKWDRLLTIEEWNKDISTWNGNGSPALRKTVDFPDIGLERIK